MERKKVVVLTGAGVSAESGIPTFRGAGGLWEGHDVMEVASPEGWEKNPRLVLNFYNERRRNALKVKPNVAHQIIASLENHFNVAVVTQNVDNLHERAGSSQVLHLHGELFKSRSTRDPSRIYAVDGWQLNWGEKCELGSQLRPHIVWFGEMVPLMDEAVKEVKTADILIIVGTSMIVYPAAGLIHYARPGSAIYVVNPDMPTMEDYPNLHLIEEKATTGMTRVFDLLTASSS